MISIESAATSGDSMRRPVVSAMRHSPATRPGRLESSTTRWPRRAASRTLWVTNTIVRPVAAPHALELLVQQVARDGVERGERLVHEEHGAVLREGAGEGDALAHAARELVRALLRGIREVDDVEELERLRAPGRARDAAEAQRELDVLPGGEPRHERRLLEHHGRALGGHVDATRSSAGRGRR